MCHRFALDIKYPRDFRGMVGDLLLLLFRTPGQLLDCTGPGLDECATLPHCIPVISAPTETSRVRVAANDSARMCPGRGCGREETLSSVRQASWG